MGLQSFRASQIWGWIYNKGVESIESFANDSLSRDGTRKLLIGFQGDEVETVFIPEARRGTLCVSSQVGCTFQCKFCYTGTQKLIRNLTAGEIVSQVLTARRVMNDFGHTTERRIVSNIVFMGQGEPLYNYRNVAKALRILTDPGGLSLSKSRITVSTSGVVPLITRLGQDFPGIGLAISLHASNNKTRSDIVPINQQWPIEELMQACVEFSKGSTQRITIEYVMLSGVNDSATDAIELGKLIRPFPSLVNLIPFNSWPGAIYECSSNEAIKQFAEILEKAGHKVTVRQSRGNDILAACGQLRTESVKVKKTLPGPPPELISESNIV
eukprot:gene17542-20933_t